MEGFQLIQLLCPISDFVEGPICGSIEISSSPSAGKEEMNPESRNDSQVDPFWKTVPVCFFR